MSSPSTVWQSDITYVLIKDRYYYAVFIIDVYTKKVVGYQVSDHMHGTANLFKNNFSTKSISTKRSKKLLRYILYGTENHLSHADYDYEFNAGTIEHILPENGNENYLEDFPVAIHESVVYRLGNYTLLEDDKNRACQALPFTEKKLIYQTSQYELSKQITANQWTPNTIDQRQERLANYASTVWRISQYD